MHPTPGLIFASYNTVKSTHILPANYRAVPAAEPPSRNKRGRPFKPSNLRGDPAASKSSSEPPPRIAHMMDGVAYRERREPGGIGLGNKVQPDWGGDESSCDHMSESSFSDEDEEGSLDSGVVRRNGPRRKKTTYTHLETKKAVSTTGYTPV